MGAFSRSRARTAFILRWSTEICACVEGTGSRCLFKCDEPAVQVLSRHLVVGPDRGCMGLLVACVQVQVAAILRYPLAVVVEAARGQVAVYP
jgi:hypothetical protein